MDPSSTISTTSERVTAAAIAALVASIAFLVPSTARSVTRPYEPPPPVVLTDEEYIRREFADDQTMVDIALAEAFDQGDLVEGDIRCAQKNPASSATGCFQILTMTWEHFLCEGDRMVREDNVACAKKIRAANGYRDWLASAHAWDGLEQDAHAEEEGESGEYLHDAGVIPPPPSLQGPGVEPAEQDDQGDDRDD